MYTAVRSIARLVNECASLRVKAPLANVEVAASGAAMQLVRRQHRGALWVGILEYKVQSIE